MQGGHSHAVWCLETPVHRGPAAKPHWRAKQAARGRRSGQVRRKQVAARDAEILALLAAGFSQALTARQCGVSRATVWRILKQSKGGCLRVSHRVSREPNKIESKFLSLDSCIDGAEGRASHNRQTAGEGPEKPIRTLPTPPRSLVQAAERRVRGGSDVRLPRVFDAEPAVPKVPPAPSAAPAPLPESELEALQAAVVRRRREVTVTLD